MAKAEIYFPETVATQIKNLGGKISFTLDYAQDFISNTYGFINNFATSNFKAKATKLYINTADTFPALSDPSGNYATHYLVILLDDNTTYVAIPICNNYRGNFSEYLNSEYLEKNLTMSIDKLLKISRSNNQDTKILIDLNSTMNELKGTPTSYEKYTSKFNETDSKIYVIDKFIYVEPAIKTSMFEQIITKKIDGSSNEGGTYSIVNITADCLPNSGRSPVYKLFKKQDWNDLIMYNIFMTVGYFLFFVVWYYCYNKIGKDYVNYIGLTLLTIPFWVYIGMVKDDELLKRTILSMCYSGIILTIPFFYGLYLLVQEIMTKNFAAIFANVFGWLKEILFYTIYQAIKFRDWKYLIPLLKISFVVLNLTLVIFGILQLYNISII